MSQQTGALQLLKSVGLFGLVWLVFLPWIAERPRMKAHLNWLDEHKINPSAMYYTELEAMEDILRRQRMFSRNPAVECATH